VHGRRIAKVLITRPPEPHPDETSAEAEVVGE
jgi:hypothetical protein